MDTRNNVRYETTAKVKEGKHGCYGGGGPFIKNDACTPIPNIFSGTRSGPVISRSYLQVPWASVSHHLRQKYSFYVQVLVLNISSARNKHIALIRLLTRDRRPERDCEQKVGR